MCGAARARDSLVPKRLLVVYDAMTVREGATLDVLTRDAHVIALQQQGAPRKLLSDFYQKGDANGPAGIKGKIGERGR